MFDVLAYERDRWLGAPGIPANPWLIVKVWDGISSYGGFVGGAAGYAFYVWWKRLTPGLIADTTMIGLLVAFTIGRMGCTIVHDHIGRVTTSSLGVDYPRREIEARAGLTFAPILTGGDTFGARMRTAGPQPLAERQPLEALTQIDWS